MDLTQESAELLRTEAAGYAAAALANIRHEFPAAMQHTMTAPGDFPVPAAGAHAGVLRQLRLALLGTDALDPAAAAAHHAGRGGRDGDPLRARRPVLPGGDGGRGRVHRQRGRPGRVPAGLGLGARPRPRDADLGHPDARKWAEAMAPLAEALASAFLGWLPGQSYPVRYGTEQGSAFGLSLAWPFAEARAGAGRPGAAGRDRGPGPRVVQRGHHVPGRLGAVGRRLPVARADRGGADGPDPATGRVRRLAGHVPARARMGPPGHLVHPGGGRRSRRGSGGRARSRAAGCTA